MRSMTNRSALVLLTALLIPAGASAQTDSLLAASVSGTNLLRLNQDGGFVVRGTVAVGSIPATGPGVRMMWFPSL